MRVSIARTCLKCSRAFTTKSRFIRLCKSCKDPRRTDTTASFLDVFHGCFDVALVRRIRGGIIRLPI
jgi:hypothetical protein